MATNYSNAGHGPVEQESAATLFSRLISDASALVRNEVALAKAELSNAANSAKLGAAALAVAAVVMLAGAMSLIAALILGLAEVMEPWLAALIVGVVLGVVGLVMLQAAKKNFKATAAPIARTQNSLQQDAAMIARRT